MKHYKYTCVKNSQRINPGAPQFLLFRAKASEIFEWAAIERHTADSKRGPQRLPKPAKVTEIKRFLEQDQRNTIPTALLVSLTVPVANVKVVGAENQEIVSVEFEFNEQATPVTTPGMIVDGQHRLLGVMQFQQDLLLNVVAMLNPSDDETAFQFLVVRASPKRSHSELF